VAISWGGTAGHMQVGIDVRHDPYDTNTPSINVYVDYYVRTVAYGAADNQVLVGFVNGGERGRFAYRMSSPSGATTTLHVGTIQVAGQRQSYGGGPGYTFQGTVEDNALGLNPTHAIGWTLPARPANIPTAPGTGVDSVTSSSARVVVLAADGRGAGVDAYQVRVQRQSDAAIIHDQVTGGTVTYGGLVRATAYVCFARAHNAVGWGPWSNALGFTTAATVPDPATAAPSVTSVLTDRLELAWAAPGNGGSAITGYDLQVSPSATFATAVTTATVATAGSVDGLVPATTYYARFRAKNAAGAGGWSPAATVATLSSAQVRVGGSWVLARVWVRTAAGWVQAKLWKRRTDGTWRL
jgi:hypothetical protein